MASSRRRSAGWICTERRRAGGDGIEAEEVNLAGSAEEGVLEQRALVFGAWKAALPANSPPAGKTARHSWKPSGRDGARPRRGRGGDYMFAVAASPQGSASMLRITGACPIVASWPRRLDAWALGRRVSLQFVRSHAPYAARGARRTPLRAAAPPVGQRKKKHEAVQGSSIAASLASRHRHKRSPAVGTDWRTQAQSCTRPSVAAHRPPLLRAAPGAAAAVAAW